jgi:DNA ligase D-like protein (predicted 3'-phosphoesterase)
MADKNFLKEYHKKRDFKITAEPFGGSKKKGKKNIFVIQKHDASNLHYDFRIEVDGLLKSWAVPKGPSTDPKEKRLAVPTEDHPLEYANFEGIIPEDQYGGGTVMVWDAGTYENINKKDEGNEIPVSESLKNGEVKISLKGKKIKGGYAVIKTGKGKNARWMLIKMKDDYADARRNPVNTQNKSVLTGRTMRQIEKEEKAKEK